MEDWERRSDVWEFGWKLFVVELLVWIVDVERRVEGEWENVLWVWGC